jgi:branched-chain amino acid transport system ATP-binding protein
VSGPILAVRGLTKRFGGLMVLDGIDLEVAPGQIHGVIGPNGAGKTTLFNVINGIYTASGGRVLLRGRDITNRSLSRIAELAGLADLRHQVAIEISGGQKKLLEFMRTMMFDPDLVLLDEPFGGINPALAERLTEIVLRLNRDQGKTFLLISHEMPSVMRLCEVVTVLAAGATIARGRPVEVRENPAVIEAYLGH